MEAAKIAAYRREELARETVNALKKVMTFASEVLPKWIQPAWKQQIFDFKKELKETEIFVGVFLASDGNSNHAITSHGGFIYNANEEASIPFCHKTLDIANVRQQKRASSLNSKENSRCNMWEGRKIAFGL